MKTSRIFKVSIRGQFFIALSLVAAVAMLCYPLTDYIGYRVVALLLMLCVSLPAIVFDARPVMTSAIASALVWNFFFIPPRFTFSINQAEDLLLFLMYFVIAIINVVLTTRVRRAEQHARQKDDEEKTLRLYNTLFNSLSHELKTPIATIIGATDNLETLADQLSETNKHALVREISHASLQLNRQVNNLLSMSRLESGLLQPRYDWCDAGELAFEVVQQLKDDGVTKPIGIVVQENLPLFRLDHGLCVQILHNLVHNAVSYISKYAVVTIRIGIRDHQLMMIVEDTGDGFPAEEIGKVFQKFYRIDAKRTGGTGLGLSIVKGLTEAMNGTVSLNNMKDGGAVFTVLIPAELSYQQPPK